MKSLALTMTTSPQSTSLCVAQGSSTADRVTTNPTVTSPQRGGDSETRRLAKLISIIDNPGNDSISEHFSKIAAIVSPGVFSDECRAAWTKISDLQEQIQASNQHTSNLLIELETARQTFAALME